MLLLHVWLEELIFREEGEGDAGGAQGRRESEGTLGQAAQAEEGGGLRPRKVGTNEHDKTT